MLSGRNNDDYKTPVTAIIAAIMRERTSPITVEELSLKVMDAWGRDLPRNPYTEYGLIYKLAVRVLGCVPSYEKLEGGIAPSLCRVDPEAEPAELSPIMRFEELNVLDDEVKDICLTWPQPVKAAKGGRKKKA